MGITTEQGMEMREQRERMEYLWRLERVRGLVRPRRFRVPRNASCPCGSGRKYKRCCESQHGWREGSA